MEGESIRPDRTPLNPTILVALLLIDYVRWTQLAPMVTMWLLALLMMAGMLFVNNQDAILDILVPVWVWLESLPWVGEPVSARMEAAAAEEGPLSLGGEDLKDVALRAWAAIALVFMLLALIAGWMFGPFKPWTLRRKLGLIAWACVLLMAGFVAVYFADPEAFNGPVSRWMLMFTGVAVLILLVSAWCLSIAHALGLLKRLISTG
jgi:hypothetical protein